ncbi:hypothetical protein [Thalassoglobus sp.]|uniref:hypothetical protein n=1 Tax=Thalassoglobus sp. TaxID=2795869 RepID=UPI003AA8AD37
MSRTLKTVAVSLSLFVLTTHSIAQDKLTAIYALDVDGKNARMISDMEGFPSVGSPDVSPDGTRIAFDGWQEGENSGDAQIFILDIKTSKTQSVGYGAMPTWSADGKYLAYSSYDPRGVCIQAADRVASTIIDPSGWGIQWSPDGKKLAYTSRGNFIIYDLLTNSKKTIQPRADNPYRSIYWNSDWSPDSKKLCFKGTLADGTYETAIVDISEDEPKLTVCYAYKGGYGNEFAWHPDGDRITTVKWSKGAQIHSFKPAANVETSPLEGQPTDRDNVAVDWSRDGKTLYFVSRPRKSE